MNERLSTSPEKKPLSAEEKREVNQKELQQQLNTIEASPERPAQKLIKLRDVYRSQLQSELQDEGLKTREQLQNLSEQMLKGLYQQRDQLEALQKKEPSSDIRSSLETLKLRIQQMEQATATSTSMSQHRELVARRLVVYQSPAIEQIRKVMVPLFLQEVKLRLEENPAQYPFEQAMQDMRSMIQELDLTDDATFISEAYLSVYSDQMLALEYENLQSLREQKESATERQRQQAFDLFVRVKYADLARLNVRSALTKDENEQLNFEKNDDVQKTLRAKLAQRFSTETLHLFQDFLKEQQMEHLLPKDAQEYLEFCSRNDRVLSTVLFQNQMDLRPSEIHQRFLQQTENIVQQTREEARELALKGQSEKAQELRNQADLYEDFHAEYEKGLRSQSLPPSGVTFSAASWAIDKIPSFRDLRYDDVLIWGPAAMIGLSTVATNVFPLGKDLFMQFYNRFWEPLTINPFKWPEMVSKMAKGAVGLLPVAGMAVGEAPLGAIGTDMMKWFWTTNSAISSVLGMGIIGLAGSKKGREMIASAFEIGAKELTGISPVASLIEGINDLTKGGLEKLSKSEYVDALKNFTYTWIWRQPVDFVIKHYDQLRSVLDGFGIKIDEIKAHQTSVVSTHDQLEKEYPTVKTITVRYEKYNSFLLNRFDEKANPDTYKVPVELMRDIGFFGRMDLIGPEKELDLISGDTFDIPYAIGKAAESNTALDTSSYLQGASILPKQILDVSGSEDGMWYITPNMVQDALGFTADYAFDDVRHPMRYLTQEELSASILNDRTELIEKLGERSIVDGEFKGSMDQYLGEKLMPNLTEKELLDQLNANAGIISGIEVAAKDLDALYPLENLSAEEKEQAQLQRKLYLVKLSLINQGFRAALDAHKKYPPQTKIMRSTAEFTPGAELFQIWKQQKEWLRKTQQEDFFSRSTTVLK